MVHACLFCIGDSLQEQCTQCNIENWSFCPRILTHEFEPAEFHATCFILSPQQNVFAKTSMLYEEICRCNMSPLNVPTTCPAVCDDLYTTQKLTRNPRGTQGRGEWSLPTLLSNPVTGVRRTHSTKLHANVGKLEHISSFQDIFIASESCKCTLCTLFSVQSIKCYSV